MRPWESFMSRSSFSIWSHWRSGWTSKYYRQGIDMLKFMLQKDHTGGSVEEGFGAERGRGSRRFLPGREEEASDVDWHWDCIFEVEFLLESLRYIVLKLFFYTELGWKYLHSGHFCSQSAEYIVLLCLVPLGIFFHSFIKYVLNAWQVTVIVLGHRDIADIQLSPWWVGGGMETDNKEENTWKVISGVSKRCQVTEGE